jgi:hypothetical protein
MDFVCEDAGFDPGIVIHNFFGFFNGGVKDANAIHIASVRNRTYDRQDPVGAKLEVSAPVFPNDFAPVRMFRFWSFAQYHQAVLPRRREHLPHEFVSDHWIWLTLPPASENIFA